MNKAAEPASPESIYAVMGGKLGVSNIGSDKDLALLVEKRLPARRISNYDTLDGAGGLEVHGRWHTRGRRIVYCAPNPATALLESLVHIRVDLASAPIRFRYLEIEAPDTTSTETVELAVLGSDWRNDEANTRDAGNLWLDWIPGVAHFAGSLPFWFPQPGTCFSTLCIPRARRSA